MKQKQALKILKMGRNVFLTGRAGAGKTYVLNKYIEYLKKNDIPVAITASTGIAATHLSGSTIHSWSGMGIKNKIDKKDIDSLLKKTYLKKHYLETSVLIIDEVSMLHAHQLDIVNQLCQIFRKDLRPFGGMQIVLSGDFFQLPPVAKYGEESKFVIESDIWQNMNLSVCYLDEQFRQDDVHFITILNEIRSGKVSTGSRDLLIQKVKENFDFQIQPTKLYTHNVDVDVLNLIELDKIKNESKSYKMTHTGRKGMVESLKKSCLAPESLILKIGAKVMFVKNNFETGVVNGTLGEVIGFDKASDYPQVKIKTGEIILVKPDTWVIDEFGKTLAEIRQFPLRLAWAITIHKSQGMSLDLAEIDLSKAFTPGMGYVALSRIRNLKGLNLKGLNSMALQVNSQILIFDKDLQLASINNFKLLEKISKPEIEERQNEFVHNNLNIDIFRKIEKKRSNRLETWNLLKQKLSLKEIIKKEGLKEGTILNHIEKLIDEGVQIDIKYLMPRKSVYQKIEKGFNECGLEKLKPVYKYLEEEYSYDDLKLVRLNLKNLKF
jgi:ATP-dependent exoDNAse (exonuclease V) alpha subunit